MDFRILGPLEVVDGDKLLDIGGAKQRTLLAMLLLHANEVVSTDRLIDAVWEDSPPARAQKALQVYISQLRKVLSRERVQTRAPGYLLRVDEGELDVNRFQALVAGGRAGDALALWRGRPLADVAYSRFARAEITRLEELRLACLEDRVDADLAAGRHAQLVGELEALVREHPVRERLRGQLMLALYRSGRQADALEAYQAARAALTDELGIEPGRELRDLQQAVLNQDPTLDAAAPEEPAADARRRALLGREAEWDELVAGLESAFAGRGSLILLQGEPGIGKSRLAEELTSHALARGARALVGRCWEAGGAPAYWPWVQALRSYIDAAEPTRLSSELGAGGSILAQLIPELREIVPDLEEPAPLESDSARFRLFEAATSFLKRAGEARPLVLVLDDLHAADEPSLLLLQFVGRELGECRLLVVGAYRDVDPTPTDRLTATLTELVREPTTTRLTLSGLDHRSVTAFIETIAGEAPSQELADAIHEETEGNPLFVREIVRLLATEGHLDQEHARRLEIPQSVRDVTTRRLRHLSDGCNRALVIASVLGREFSIAALALVSDVAEEELLAMLDEAMAAGVVSDVPDTPDHLRFAHVLIRDTLYEGLTVGRRVQLHRKVVAGLESLYGDAPGAHLAELAFHCIAGSDFNRGLGYASHAGDRALALLAYEEAARLYLTALTASEQTNATDETRCELLLSLGEAEIRAGNTSRARDVFLEAAAIARRIGLSHALARAAAGYGGRIVLARAGDDARLVPLLEDGLAVLGDTDVELRARLLARLAGASRDEHDRARRDALSSKAVELARRAANPAVLAYALDGRIGAIFGPDTVAERLRLADELKVLAEGTGDSERVVAAHFHRFIGLSEAGDLEVARMDLRTAVRIAEELGQPAQLWWVTSAQAMMALAEGRLSDAEDLVTRAFALGERAQPGLAIPVYGLQQYTLAEFRGRLGQVEPVIRDLVSGYPARPVFRCALAHLCAKLHRHEEARLQFAALARDGFGAVPFDLEWMYAMSLLAETGVLLAEREIAPALYGALLPYAAFNAVDHPEGFRGAMSRYVGMLAAMLERWGDAEQHFEQALELNERMDARPWLAYTQEDYARMLMARARSGDPARARDLMDRAFATYRELGMHGPLHEAPTKAAPL